MNNTHSQYPTPPRSRARLRLVMGKVFYTCCRYLQWIYSGKKYASIVQSDPILTQTVFSHKTILLRQLSNVDMQLQINKTTNLRLAAAHINHLVIKPGETFSFWRLVGKPTRRKGYLDGMVLCNGGFYAGTGGGLCQLSNLIYWMTIHTPLTVVERWRHNFDVFPDSDRTQPFGSGATVSYNYIDLQIKNETSSDYQLLIWLDDQYLHGEWRSNEAPNSTYQVYERKHFIDTEWWGGFTRRNLLYRKEYDADGNEIDDEFVCANQAVMMYEPLLPKV